MITPDLILDPQLKYWVLLPISFVMVLVGLIRANVTFLMSPRKKLEDYKLSREKQFLSRSMAFTANNWVLSPTEFNARKQYFIETLNSDKYLVKTDDSAKDPMAALTDPSTNEAMMNMMKGNLMNYIPQTLIMGWVNYFFAGFVIMKLPFPLTDGFKSMLQTGIQTPDLNVRYVSSISWYFVNLFGLKPIYSLIMSDSKAVEQLMNQQQQQNQMPNFGTPGGPKSDKVFSSQAENIQILSQKSVFDGIAERVILRHG